jgi:hypothetical protein
MFYNFNGVSTDGDTQVDIYPIPDAVYDFRFNVTQRNLELSEDADTTVLPTRPIILLATAMAIEERGEDGGQQSMNAYQLLLSQHYQMRLQWMLLVTQRTLFGIAYETTSNSLSSISRLLWVKHTREWHHLITQLCSAY